MRMPFSLTQSPTTTVTLATIPLAATYTGTLGPFALNIGYTPAAVANGSVKFGNGVDKYGVFGYTFYDPSGKIPTNTFDGVPLQNGQVAARRLNALGSNDRQRAVNYAGQKNGPARGRSYDTWHQAFANFFKCYKGN